MRDAWSSPTRTAASPGVIPVSWSARTRSATSLRICAATALPSRMRALTASILAAARGPDQRPRADRCSVQGLSRVSTVVGGETAMEIEATDRQAAGSLEELYIRHAPAGFRLALLLTGDRALAEDIVQDAFVRVVGRFGHLRAGSSFEAYLRRTIVNLTKNTWRRRSVERAHQADALPEM